MSQARAQLDRRLRGQILYFLRENHEQQQSRLDDVTLAGVLARMRFDVSVNSVRTMLQDMKERQLVGFDQERDPMTGKISIRQIQITWRGRDVLDGTIADPSVETIG